MTLSIEAALNKDQRSAKTRAASALQHRHYAVIAGIIADLPSAMRGDVASEFARALATNPNFNRARFLRACGED